MKELIKITYNNDNPAISARELHEFLEVKTVYNDWFKRMCEYGFVNGQDFNFLKNEKVQKEGNRMVSRTIDDAVITVDMAKEICMLQRNEKGKQARQYFIELERQWNSPETVFARALKIAERKIDNLHTEIAQKNQLIGELTPKANYVDIILDNKGLVTITQIAKDYGMSGNRMNKLLFELGIQYKQSGQWLLYSKYHNMGYTHSKTIDITRSDGRPDIVMETKWTQKGRLFIYEKLKLNGIIPVIEQDLAS